MIRGLGNDHVDLVNVDAGLGVNDNRGTAGKNLINVLGVVDQAVVDGV